MAVAKENKLVRGQDLYYVGQRIKENFATKVDGKGLSTNDYTTDEKTKLAGIESGAQKNVKPDWNAASGSAAEILNKPAAVQPATADPLMDGTAAVGSSAKYAKEDHVHPSDTSKADKATTLAGYGITNAYTKTEVDTAISNAMKGGYVVVNPLPTASADTMGKIYLVPMTDTEDNNVKEEYITYYDGSTYKWEKLGTTQFDNSDYEERLTVTEITTLLNL